MSEGRVYSQRLGAIADSQFVAVCERLGLGTFLRAEPTSSGLFGQNVFVTTSEGEFVLRGAPHWVKDVHETEYWPQDRWQFTKEAFFARMLHERTSAPVAWPYVLEDTTDIFGWPFAILPRMPGLCLDRGSPHMRSLRMEDWQGIARAMAANLVAMQRLRWELAGDIDLRSMTFEPYMDGEVEYLITAIVTIAGESQQGGAWTSADQELVDVVVAEARSTPQRRPITFVHRDYKIDNLTVMRDERGEWSVSGIFDLHGACFGDGAYDVVRSAVGFLDASPPLARIFVSHYFSALPPDGALLRLLPLYVLFERIQIWGYFSNKPEGTTMFAGKTFRTWVKPYLAAFQEMMPSDGQS